MEFRLVHRVRLDAGGDPRALDGAVTVALCGAGLTGPDGRRTTWELVR